MSASNSTITLRASELAQAFGRLVRSRRQALRMSQDQVALATGVGRRFLIDLEAGKLSCQLGRSLVVAEILGLRPIELMTGQQPVAAAISSLPELPELEESDD
jgi:transcriptional regulator with XRE-family HTH domain